MSFKDLFTHEYLCCALQGQESVWFGFIPFKLFWFNKNQYFCVKKPQWNNRKLNSIQETRSKMILFLLFLWMFFSFVFRSKKYGRYTLRRLPLQQKYHNVALILMFIITFSPVSTVASLNFLIFVLTNVFISKVQVKKRTFIKTSGPLYNTSLFVL